MFYRYQDSPIGRLFMVGDDAGLQQLLMDVERTPWRIGDDWRAAGSQLDDVSRQLDEYFSGRRQRFGLRLNPQGTAFSSRCGAPCRTSPSVASTATAHWPNASTDPRLYVPSGPPMAPTRSASSSPAIAS